MSEQPKTHWKKLDNPDYLGAYSILDGSKNPKPIIAKIEKVRLENVTGSGGKKEECKVCYLVGQKPLILNATNSKAIAMVAKSPYIEDWQGVTIEIYATTTKMAGEVVDCLRVRTSAPKIQVKPPFDETYEKYDSYIQSIKKSDKGLSYIIEKLSKDFTITPETHDFLAQIVGTEIHADNA